MAKYQLSGNRLSTFVDPDLVSQFPYLPMAGQAIGGYFDWRPMLVTVGMEILVVSAALKIATILVEREDFMMDSSGGAFLRLLRRWTGRGQEGGGPVAG